MATIQPFRALRPQPEIASKLASRPYDVLNSDEARAEANGNAYSFLHVTKPEIDLSPGINVYSQEVYNKAKENLEKMINDGILLTEEKPCYYIYQLVMPARPESGGAGRSQTGLVDG